MTLGEKIFTLRNQSKLSQGELAEKLNVSRQSISKWETGASVPELDKLISLSEVFGVTLDELAKGDALPRCAPEPAPVQPAPTPVPPAPAPRAGALDTQKILGLILFGVGLLCCVLALLLGEGFFLIGGYLLFCGTVCLCVKRNAGLVIGWATLIPILIFAPYWTGLQLFFVLNPSFYAQGISINQILTVAFWFLAAFLTVATVRRFRHKKKNRTESKTHK